MSRYLITTLLFISSIQTLMANQDIKFIDDRSSSDLHSQSGDEWALITDGVMGGISDGQLSIDNINNRSCLRMTADVKLENNGGFVQVALNLPKLTVKNINKYTGLMLEVLGNNEQYNIHLRTHDTWLPWQSYRATFEASSEWNTLYIPFTEFQAYRINKVLNIDKLKRIGLVAIGRRFSADLCLGKIGLYK